MEWRDEYLGFVQSYNHMCSIVQCTLPPKTDQAIQCTIFGTRYRKLTVVCQLDCMRVEELDEMFVTTKDYDLRRR